MTLLRRILLTYGLVRDQQLLIHDQNVLLNDLTQALRTARLEHNREMQGLVAAWLISLEMPEADIREDLAQLERELGNRVAALEEHVL